MAVAGRRAACWYALCVRGCRLLRGAQGWELLWSFWAPRSLLLRCLRTPTMSLDAAVVGMWESSAEQIVSKQKPGAQAARMP